MRESGRVEIIQRVRYKLTPLRFLYSPHPGSAQGRGRREGGQEGKHGVRARGRVWGEGVGEGSGLVV